jgi:UDP:flavonoid glycosyltransferase YjiC (YdhE family)
MRFLFTCIPAFGHLHAMVPYAQALKDQGHDVAFATGAAFAQAVRSAGFHHFSCGIENASSVEVLTHLPEWPSIQDRFRDAPPGTAQLHAFIEVLAPQMLSGLSAVVEKWNPHLVVRDPLEFGGYIAAERVEIPHVVVDWAIHIPTQVIAKDALCLLRRRYGLPEDANLETLDRHLVLSAMPPSWKYDGVPYAERLFRCQLPPYDNDGQFDDPLPDLIHSGRPVVYATLGTTFNQSPDTFQSIIEALGAEDVSAIVTLGHSFDPSELGAIPKNVHVANYIPQTSLLPHCDAVIFHAGFNSLHSALWHGLPMILIPMGAGDQVPNAMQAVAMKVGLIAQQPLAVESLRQNIRSVLTDSQLRCNARKLQAEIKALPPVSEAVHRLMVLARESA